MATRSLDNAKNKKQQEIEPAYQELASANTVPVDKVDYWADYEEALWEQYLEEKDILYAEQEAIDRAKELEQAKKSLPQL